jgi:hypothetical protein
MGWTVRGSNPSGGARFFAPVQTSPGAHPGSYTMGTGSFPGVKQPGCGIDHPPPSRAEIKERVELDLRAWAFMACYRVQQRMCVTFNMYARNCLEKEVASYPLSKDTLYCNSRKNSVLNFVAPAAAVPLLFGCFHTSVLGGRPSLLKTKKHVIFFRKR